MILSLKTIKSTLMEIKFLQMLILPFLKLNKEDRDMKN
jgi:hypothetical protein